MTDTSKMQLVDWLDDLCVRFIINLPHEELLSVERICFQIEEAQWFYEDFLRPLDPSLPSMNLRRFALLMFQHCPLSAAYPQSLHLQAYENFLAYKTRVPVRGAIMLNDDMTHAVLVKGWKKGAKWSFPRGKINKEEANLDCAVREVYEETGYDLKEAGLVGSDEQMKKIVVSMREQEMMLYVFRGVPMNTYFEPRTRKEISKIDWYKLTDLPTIKRNKHVQQGTGQDVIKENSFYMVAPFLGPLKGWIKQQHRMDKQRLRSGANLAPPIPATITDTELEPDVGETTADEAPIPQDNLADLVAKLGRHRPSDALPEVSEQPQEQAMDPAAELKRLLSVGSGQAVQTPPVEAPMQTNPLLAMLQGNSKPVEAQPKTPFDQFIPPPPQPHSPHGQHHPRAPHIDHMSPPPPFPFHPGAHQPQNLPFRGPQHHQQHHPRMPPQPHNGPPMPFQRPFMPPQAHGNPHFPDMLSFAIEAPNVHQAPSQQAPRPYQRTGDPQFAHPSQLSDAPGPRVPAAADLPAPKLTAHTLGLLNAFKSQEKPQVPAHPLQNIQEIPPMHHQPPIPSRQESFTSPHGQPSAHPYAPTPPPFQSSPPSSTFQPVQPKPRSAHQDSLLNLFRSPSLAAATPAPTNSEEGPVELSAQPTTPGYTRLPQQGPQPPLPDATHKANLLAAFGQQAQPNKAGVTTATVTGPVNVPDFETVKKNTHLTDLNGHGNSRGNSRGPSPNQRKSAEQKMFVPQQILKRNDTASSILSPTEIRPTSKGPSPTTSNISTPQATTFKPQILRRPQQSASPAPTNPILALLENHASPKPTSVEPVKSPPLPIPVRTASALSGKSSTHQQASFDRRDTLPENQKSALLSLFSSNPSLLSSTGASPIQRAPLPDSFPPNPVAVPPEGVNASEFLHKYPGLPTLPTTTGTSHPSHQTPKQSQALMSGVISPVSPLPTGEKAGSGSKVESPAHLGARSRISSIGDSIPPTILPGEEAFAGIGIRAGERKTATSPVDRSFLLGFLENVAKGGAAGVAGSTGGNGR